MLAPPSTGKDAVDRFEDQTDKFRRYLKNNIFFDLSGAPQWGKAQLECAVKVVGADHILYGGSYPHSPRLVPGRRRLRAKPRDLGSRQGADPRRQREPAFQACVRLRYLGSAAGCNSIGGSRRMQENRLGDLLRLSVPNDPDFAA